MADDNVFDSAAEAFLWMYAEVDDPCMDNERIAPSGDRHAMSVYWQQQAEGCCGFFDKYVVIGGKGYWIGCNYGH